MAYVTPPVRLTSQSLRLDVEAHYNRLFLISIFFLSIQVLGLLVLVNPNPVLLVQRLVHRTILEVSNINYLYALTKLLLIVLSAKLYCYCKLSFKGKLGLLCLVSFLFIWASILNGREFSIIISFIFVYHIFGEREVTFKTVCTGFILALMLVFFCSFFHSLKDIQRNLKRVQI